jgi:ParB family chromosome partitioning protein
MEEKIMEIDVNLIDEPMVLLHPEEDLAYLEELAQSIKEHGLLNPIIVRPKGNRYELIAGYRRWLACKKFGIPKIKARVVYFSDTEALLSTAIENIQRTDLDPIQEGKLYYKLIYEQGQDIKEVAKKVGKSISYIEARLKVLEMPQEIQDLVRAKKLQLGVIPLLTKISKTEDRILVASDIAHRGYTVKDAEYFVNAFLKYSQTMKEASKQEIIEKAHQIPIAECPFCHQEKKVTTFRQLTLCDECYNHLIYLYEKEKVEKSS